MNLANGGLQLAKANLDFKAQLMDIQARFSKARTQREVRRILVAEQKVMRDAAMKNARLLPPIVESYREIGTITSSLLNSADEGTGDDRGAK